MVKRDEFDTMLSESRMKQNLSSKLGITGAALGLAGFFAGTEIDSSVLNYSGLALIGLSTLGYLAYSYFESEKFNNRANEFLNEYFKENK